MRAALVVFAVSGCYSPSPPAGSPCTQEGTCPEGLECRGGLCELPGTSDAALDAPPDGCAGTCVGDKLHGCGQPVTCANGCADTPSAHCRALSPSNGLTTALLDGATADVPTNAWVFDTDTGEIRAGATTLRAAGTGLISEIRFDVVDGAGVFVAHSFDVGMGDTWHIRGSRPAVLYAATTLGIAGRLDATASFDAPGPGGLAANASTEAGDCRGRAGRLLSAQHAEGGGGAGGATAGADGGASDAANPTGKAGAQCTVHSTTRPLRGGAAGGAGGASTTNAGGGGGGALMLVAMDSITLASSAVVSVSGGGGMSGAEGAAPSGEGGGGGGAGGALLLEAPALELGGALTANGGSGASPHVTDGRNGALASAVPVLGGSYTANSISASGGNGGAGTTAPTAGGTYTYDDGLGTPTSVTSRGGGGGGAVGRIELRGSAITGTPTASPAPSTSTPDYQ